MRQIKLIGGKFTEAQRKRLRLERLSKDAVTSLEALLNFLSQIAADGESNHDQA